MRKSKEKKIKVIQRNPTYIYPQKKRRKTFIGWSTYCGGERKPSALKAIFLVSSHGFEIRFGHKVKQVGSAGKKLHYAKQLPNDVPNATPILSCGYFPIRNAYYSLEETFRLFFFRQTYIYKLHVHRQKSNKVYVEVSVITWRPLSIYWWNW